MVCYEIREPPGWLVLLAVPAHARNVIQVQWESVCAASQGRELTIAAVNGDKVRGYCKSTANNELTVEKNGRRVSVIRIKIAHIRMRVPTRLAISDVGDQILLTLAIGGWAAPTRYWPAALIMPVLAAGEVAALPFVAFADLIRYLNAVCEIQVIHSQTCGSNCAAPSSE